MRELKREEGGWVVALSWLSALEETARDFHGTRPHTFCERAYEHAVRHFLSQMELDYGIACEAVRYRLRGDLLPPGLGGDSPDRQW